MSTLLLILLGVTLLIAGAEGLVQGASRLASGFGLSPLVIGLTVVAFGTSAPELTVSVFASLSGQPDIALANVVGSNIFNVLFILGLSAAVAPLVVSQQVVRSDVPLVIAASMLVLLLALDGRLGRIDGALLVSGIVVYTTLLVRLTRVEPGASASADGVEASRGRRVALDLAFVVGGLGLLVLGSRWMVRGAVAIAEALGVSEAIIGLTIIAAGTSLPEVAASVMASLRGQRDIAVGNVLGSCLFNLLGILGIASVVAPDGISVPASIIGFDLAIMIAASVACLPILFTGHRIDRWEGWLFLGYYVAYTVYLILGAADHDALHAFSAVMGLFVVPLTVVTLVVLALRARRTQSR